jgi:hypothetical protein
LFLPDDVASGTRKGLGAFIHHAMINTTSLDMDRLEAD